jgi:hypothetical protein
MPESNWRIQFGKLTGYHFINPALYTNMNFRQWFESDPGPTQMAPANGPNPMQIPIDLPKNIDLEKDNHLIRKRHTKTPRPLGNVTPNFPLDRRDF